MSATLDQISSLIQARRFPEAFSALSAALSKDPQNWNLRYLLGFAYRCVGDYASAITAYSDAAQLAPDEAGIFLNLGVAYQLAGDYPQAIASLERAITLKPAYPNAYNSLGYTHKLAGRYDNAIKAYDRGLDAHASLIYSGLENSRSSRIFKHQDVMGEVCMQKAMDAALRAAARAGLNKLAFPSGESAEREEQTEEHEGLYYVDMDSNGRHIRMLLPNYFNTFRERLRGDLLAAMLLNNLGGAFLSLDNRATARARYIESIYFIPPGTDYPPPYDGLQQCDAE
jgi:tetratricopeptide (TPR) repeat protein